MSQIKCLLVAAVACFPSARLAQAQAFNFDGLAIGSYFSITQTIGGQTLTVTTLPVVGLVNFIDAENPQVPLLGPVSLAGVGEHIQDFLIPLQFSFLIPVSSITFAFGDNGGDDDSPARIEAFDPFGNALGLFDTPYPAGKSDGATRTLTFGGVGAKSFVVSSGSPAVPNAFYWEVAASTASTVPEPASLVLVASGLALLGVAYCWRELRQHHSPKAEV